MANEQTAAVQPKHRRNVGMTALALGALGVVFGDIGTSPLYALQTVFSADGFAVKATESDVFGVISLVFWTIMIVVTIEFVIFVMRADNDGEGGIMALIALVQTAVIKRPWVKPALVAAGLFGVALFFGDGMITPAISVMSAVSGLKVISPSAGDLVVPITLVVLTGLFVIQRYGTNLVGKLFGPVMVIWFVIIGVAGLLQLTQDAAMLKALLPTYAVSFFVNHLGISFIALGSIVLTITGTEVEAAHTAYLQRLARELTRFLASTGRTGRLQAAFCTGGASRLAGTHEMLEAVLGVPVKELDVLGKLQHDLDSDQVKELGARLTTAVGLALSRLGGPEGFQLRQEDLVLTRGFERAKFPLAIACMVALVALFVVANKRTTELRLLELEIGSTFLDKKNPKATPQFFGMLFEVFKGGWFENPLHFRLEQSKGKDYTAKDLTAELVAAPVHRRIGIVHDRLKSVANQKQKESGIYEDVSLESGLAVLVRWAELLNRVESQLGRFLVTKVELSMKGQTRRLEFWVAFRDSDFRSRRSALQREIDAELQKADSPFVLPPKSDDRKDEERFRDTEKGGMPGAYYRVTLHVKDSFRPFGVGGTPARAADPQGGEK